MAIAGLNPLVPGRPPAPPPRLPLPGMAGQMPGAPPSPAAPQALGQAGLQARARIWVISARKVLMMALPLLQASSEDGQAVIKAISALSKFEVVPENDMAGTEDATLKPTGMPSSVGPGPESPVSALGGQAAVGGGGMLPTPAARMGAMPPTGMVFPG